MSKNARELARQQAQHQKLQSEMQQELQQRTDALRSLQLEMEAVRHDVAEQVAAVETERERERAIGRDKVAALQMELATGRESLAAVAREKEELQERLRLAAKETQEGASAAAETKVSLSIPSLPDASYTTSRMPNLAHDFLRCWNASEYL